MNKFLMILSLLLVLAACGGESTTSNNPTGPSTDIEDTDVITNPDGSTTTTHYISAVTTQTVTRYIDGSQKTLTTTIGKPSYESFIAVDGTTTLTAMYSDGSRGMSITDIDGSSTTYYIDSNGNSTCTSGCAGKGESVFLNVASDVGIISAEILKDDSTTSSLISNVNLNYGSVRRNGILEAGDYELNATQLDISDPASSPTILNGASFSVIESKLRLHVFSGSYEDGTIGLTSLQLTEDTADNYTIFIKVANIKLGIGAVDIYLVNETESVGFDISANNPDATIPEMGVSETISLTNSEQQLIVTTAGTDDVLFDSGLKTIADRVHQIIVLAEPHSRAEDFTAFYYTVSGIQQWFSIDGQTDARVFNALNSQGITSVSASNIYSSGPAVDVYSDSAPLLTVGDLSPYISLASSRAYELDFNYTSGSQLAMFSLVSGHKLTFAVIGNATNGDIQIVKIIDNQQDIFTESRLSITHLGYNSDQDALLSYDIHILRNGISENLDTRIPEMAALSYKNTAWFSKNKGEYSVVVKKTGSNSSIPPISLDLTDGSNHQLVIIEDGAGGYKICDITACLVN